MRTLLFPSIVLLFLSSCITTSHVHYSDPNYLESSEFSSYDDFVTVPTEELEATPDTSTITNNYYDDYYEADDYYDYSYSSRIRRFHRPMYYSNYYGGLYTDYYWYNNDPFYCGTSIYYGYNWHSPYYSYYSYSPYYYSYYNPYYYNSYYSYGYNNHHHTPTYTYYNSHDNNSHTTGHRGSLSSLSNSIGVKINANTIIQNTNSKTSTVHIRNNSPIKNNFSKGNIKNTYRGNTTIKNTTNRGNTTIKTNNSYRENTSIKKNTSRGSNTYTTPKSNTTKKRYSSPKRNKSYSAPKSNRSYNSGSNRSSSGSRSSGSSNSRSVKPRK